MKRLLFVCILSLLVWGCQHDDLAPRAESIKIHSTLDVTPTVSRGVAVNETPLLGIQFLRKDGLTAPTDYSSSAAFTGNRTAEGAIVFSGADPIYDLLGKNAYLAAYFPVTTVTNPSTKIATWTIDGKTDILAAPVFNAGSFSSPITGPMVFQHQLAQLEVICQADQDPLVSEAVIQFLWGKVTKIELLDTPTTLIYQYATMRTENGTTLGKFSLYQKDYDTALAPVALTKNNVTPEVTAAGMFAPAGADDTTPIKLKVYTETEPLGKEVSVQLQDGSTPKGFEVGKCHKITLQFKAKDKNIELLATTIEGWKAGYVGEGVLIK